MRILITGSEGFIGRHLTAELREHDHQVSGVDLQPCLGNGDFIRTDLTMDGEIDDALGAFSPEVVVHLAAQVGRAFGEDDLRHTVRSNAEMTTILAHACAKRKIRVLYASTSEVYGDQGDIECWEDSALLLPHNLYGLTKRWGEEALRLYAPQDLQIVRLSMPYGPGAPPGRGRRALDNILHQAHHGMRIPIHKGAERSWCWVADTVAGIRLVLEEGERGFTRGGLPSLGYRGIYNIGRDDRPISMHQLALMCCMVTGANPDLIDQVDPPSAQTVVKRLSTHKLRTLGWTPTVELDEGLPKVLDWIKGFDTEGNPLPECRICGKRTTATNRRCPIHGGGISRTTEASQ